MKSIEDKTDAEIIVEQAEIIVDQSEIISLLSGLIKDVLPLLAQYQSVEVEERRYNEITKLGGGKSTWEA